MAKEARVVTEKEAYRQLRVFCKEQGAVAPDPTEFQDMLQDEADLLGIERENLVIGLVKVPSSRMESIVIGTQDEPLLFYDPDDGFENSLPEGFAWNAA